MKAVSNKFLAWLMGLTTITRYFVIALLLHVLVVLGLASVKIVVVVSDIVAELTGGMALPPPSDDLPEDPYAVYRDFEYQGPDLGEGGGLGGKGPGGNPLAGGQQYRATIAAAPAAGAPSVGEVIGVFSDAATAIARPVATGPTGVGAAPVSGIGDIMGGAGGVRGPGGPWLGAGRIGPRRSINLKQFGGSQETERAVLAALRWLKANQKPDGSWELRADAGTALGALCFLGHGENADSPEFGQTVQRALERLAKIVPADGDVPGGMYEQGLVTLALAEGYILTGSPMLREPLERATRLILRAQAVKKQNPLNEGGWRYGPNAADSDVSVSGWVFMGLKSAQAAGVEVPQSALDKAANYFWNMYHESGGFGYSSPGNSPSMTAVGVFCLQLAGHGRDKRIEKCLDNIRKQTMNWKEDGGWTIYRWYYATLAMFQGGRTHWDYWNRIMRETLLKNQNSDGSWDLPPKDAAGGHSIKGMAARVYATTMATLMLEVYYRYLPMYQIIDRDILNPPTTPGTPAAGARS
ncbi:MAG: terpene cyclase/mutase family protein [Verrucomicrobiae bacterium]|nr:terpene cyclase/mutase family protein [Verrucomicrobiae bacterium]